MTPNISLTNGFNTYYHPQQSGSSSDTPSQQGDGSLPPLNIQRELRRQINAPRLFTGTVTHHTRERVKRHLKDDPALEEFLLEPAMAAQLDFQLTIKASYSEVIAPLFEHLDPHLRGGFLRQLLRPWFEQCVGRPVSLKETTPPDIDILVHCPRRNLDTLVTALEPLLFKALAQKLSRHKKHLYHCYKALAMVACVTKRQSISMGGEYTLTTLRCQGSPDLEVILFATLKRREICLLDSLSLSLKTGVLKGSDQSLIRQAIEDNAAYRLTVRDPDTLDLVGVMRLISHITCGGTINGNGVLQQILAAKLNDLAEHIQEQELIDKLIHCWKNHHPESEKHLSAMCWNLYVAMPRKLQALYMQAMKGSTHFTFQKASSHNELPRQLAASLVPTQLIASDGKLWIRATEHGVHWLLSVEELNRRELLQLIQKIGKTSSVEILGRLFSNPELIQQFPLGVALLGQADTQWHSYGIGYLSEKEVIEAVTLVHPHALPLLLRFVENSPISAECFTLLIKKTMQLSRQRVVYAELTTLAALAAKLQPVDSFAHQGPCEWLVQYQPDFEQAITLYLTFVQKGFIPESCATTSFLLEKALDQDELAVARFFWEKNPPLTDGERDFLQQQTARLALETGDDLIPTYTDDIMRYFPEIPIVFFEKCVGAGETITAEMVKRAEPGAFVYLIKSVPHHFYLLLEKTLEHYPERSIAEELSLLEQTYPENEKPAKNQKHLLEKAAIVAVKANYPEAHLWVKRCADVDVDLQQLLREKAFEAMTATEMMDDPCFCYVKKTEAHRLLSTALLEGRESPPDAIFWRAYTENHFTHSQALKLLRSLISKFSFETSSWLIEFLKGTEKVPFDIFSQLPNTLAVAIAPQFLLEEQHLKHLLSLLGEDIEGIHKLLSSYRESLSPSWVSSIADLTASLLASNKHEKAKVWLPYLNKWAEQITPLQANKLCDSLVQSEFKHELLLIASQVTVRNADAIERLMGETEVHPRTGWKLIQRYEVKTESLLQKIIPPLIAEEWIPEAVLVVQEHLQSSMSEKWYSTGVSILESAAKHETQGFPLDRFCEPLVPFYSRFEDRLPLFEIICNIRNTHIQAYLSAVLANLNENVTQDITPWHALMERWCRGMIADPVNSETLEYAHFVSAHNFFDAETKKELKLLIACAHIDQAVRTASSETAVTALEFICTNAAMIHTCEETYTKIAPHAVTLLCDCFCEYQKLQWCAKMIPLITRKFFVREAIAGCEFTEKVFKNRESALEFCNSLEKGAYTIISRSVFLTDGTNTDETLVATKSQLERRKFDLRMKVSLAEKLLTALESDSKTIGQRMSHARNILCNIVGRYLEEHQSVVELLHTFIFTEIPSDDLELYQKISLFRAQTFEYVCKQGIQIKTSPKLATQIVFYLSHTILVSSMSEAEVLKTLLSLCNRLFESEHPGHIVKAMELYGVLFSKFRELKGLKSIEEYFVKACNALQHSALPIHCPVTTDSTCVNAINSQLYTYISQQFLQSELLKTHKPSAREKAVIERIAFHLLVTGVKAAERFINHPTYPLLINSITTTFFSILHEGIANANLHTYLEIAESYHSHLLKHIVKSRRVDELLIPFDFEHHAYPKYINYRKPLRVSKPKHYHYRINLLRNTLETLKKGGADQSISTLIGKSVSWGWFERVSGGEAQLHSIRTEFMPEEPPLGQSSAASAALDTDRIQMLVSGTKDGSAVALEAIIDGSESTSQKMSINERRTFIIKLIDRFAHHASSLTDPDASFVKLYELCHRDIFLLKQLILTCAKNPMPIPVLMRFSECINFLHGDKAYKMFLLQVIKVFVETASKRKEPQELGIIHKILAKHIETIHADTETYEAVAKVVTSLMADTDVAIETFRFVIEKFLNRNIPDQNFTVHLFDSIKECDSFISSYPGQLIELIRLSNRSGKAALLTSLQADQREKDLSFLQDLTIKLISDAAKEDGVTGEKRVALIEFIIKHLVDQYPEYASRLPSLLHLFALMPLNPAELDLFHTAELTKYNIIVYAIQNGVVFAKNQDIYAQLCCYLDLDQSVTKLSDKEVVSASLELIWLLMKFNHSGYTIKASTLFNSIESHYPHLLTNEVRRRYFDTFITALNDTSSPQWSNLNENVPEVKMSLLYAEAYKQVTELLSNYPDMNHVAIELLSCGIKMAGRFSEHPLHQDLCSLITSSFFWFVHCGAMNKNWGQYFVMVENYLHHLMATGDISNLISASHILDINPSTPSVSVESKCVLKDVNTSQYNKILELIVRLLTHLKEKEQDEQVQNLLSEFIQWKLFDIIPNGSEKLREIHTHFPTSCGASSASPSSSPQLDASLAERLTLFDQAEEGQRRRCGLELVDFFSRSSFQMSDPAVAYNRITQAFARDEFLLQQLMIGCAKLHVPQAIRLKVAKSVILNSSKDSWTSSCRRFWTLASNWPDLATLCEHNSLEGEVRRRFVIQAVTLFAQESISRKEPTSLAALYRVVKSNVLLIQSNDKAYYAVAHALVTLLPLTLISEKEFYFFIQTFLTRNLTESGFAVSLFDSVKSCDAFLEKYNGETTKLSICTNAHGKTVLMTKSQMCRRSEDASFKIDLAHQLISAEPVDAEQVALYRHTSVRTIIKHLIDGYPEVSKEVPSLLHKFTFMQLADHHVNLFHEVEKLKRELFNYASTHKVDFTQSQEEFIQLRFYFLRELPISPKTRCTIANQSFKLIWTLLNYSHTCYLAKATVLFDRLLILFPDLTKEVHARKYFIKLLKALQTTTVPHWEQPNSSHAESIIPILYTITHQQLTNLPLPDQDYRELSKRLLDCGNKMLGRLREHPFCLIFAISLSTGYYNFTHNGCFNSDWHTFFNLVRNYIEILLSHDNPVLIRVSTYPLQFDQLGPLRGQPSACKLSQFTEDHYELRKNLILRVLYRLKELGSTELDRAIEEFISWGVFKSIADVRKQLEAYQKTASSHSLTVAPKR